MQWYASWAALSRLSELWSPLPQESSEGHSGPSASAGNHIHAVFCQPRGRRDLSNCLHLLQLVFGVLPGRNCLADSAAWRRGQIVSLCTLSNWNELTAEHCAPLWMCTISSVWAIKTGSAHWCFGWPSFPWCFILTLSPLSSYAGLLRLSVLLLPKQWGKQILLSISHFGFLPDTEASSYSPSPSSTCTLSFWWLFLAHIFRAQLRLVMCRHKWHHFLHSMTVSSLIWLHEK